MPWIERKLLLLLHRQLALFYVAQRPFDDIDAIVDLLQIDAHTFDAAQQLIEGWLDIGRRIGGRNATIWLSWLVGVGLGGVFGVVMTVGGLVNRWRNGTLYRRKQKLNIVFAITTQDQRLTSLCALSDR